MLTQKRLVEANYCAKINGLFSKAIFNYTHTNKKVNRKLAVD